MKFLFNEYLRRFIWSLSTLKFPLACGYNSALNGHTAPPQGVKFNCTVGLTDVYFAYLCSS